MFGLIELVVERFILEDPLIFFYLLLCVMIPCLIYRVLAILWCRKKEKWNPQQMVWILLFLLYLAVVYHLMKIGTFEYMMDSTLSSTFTVHMNLSILNYLMMLSLGVFLPLIWIEFRSLKQFAAVGFLFLLLIASSQLFAFQTIEVGQFIAHMLGIVSGYLIFKYIYIFFHKGIAFKLKSENSLIRSSEGIVYLLLSFTGVFLFYRPTSISVQLSNQDSYPVTILDYEMRSIVLIPISEMDLDATDDDILELPENAHIIWIDDLEDEFFWGFPICQILGTCYDGVIEFLSEEMITLTTWPIGPMWLPDMTSGRYRDFTCGPHESHDFLICLPLELYRSEVEAVRSWYDPVEKQFQITDDTIFQVWYYSIWSPSEPRIEVYSLDTWDDFSNIAVSIEGLGMRIYVAECDGFLLAEKAVIIIWE